MHIIIERGALMRALGHVTSVVERRTTIPIVGHVLMKAADGRLTVRATDLEREVSDILPAETLRPGATTASAHVLNDIVRKLPDGTDVEMKLADGRLSVKAGRSRFQLQTLPPGDFPDMGGGTYPHTFEMDPDDLRFLIDKTRFAISTEETRYYLNGIFLHQSEQKGQATFQGAATDGHRLGHCHLPLPKGAAGMPGIILPRKTVGELHRILEATDHPLEVAVSATKIRFSTGNVALVSRLIEGTFPDFQRVIPHGNGRVIDLATADFRLAIDRVTTVASERVRVVKLSLRPNELGLSVTNTDGDAASEDVSAVYDAEPMEIGFNGRYLLDICAQMDGERIRIALDNPGAPALIADGDRAIYVLMPMKV